MANVGEEQPLLFGKDGDSATITRLIHMLPALYYGLNRIFEVCAPAISKKVVVVLLTLATSRDEDAVGTFITTADINRTFRDWFIASEGNVSSDVSKVKKEMFDLNYIKIECAPDNIHLTARGEEALRETLAKAEPIISETLSVLSPTERLQLEDFAKRMLGTIRKRAVKEKGSDKSGQVDVA